jgi:hypothetical protein
MFGGFDVGVPTGEFDELLGYTSTPLSEGMRETIYII